MTEHQINPEQYQIQLAAKQQQLQLLMGVFEPCALETFASPPSHYRMRAEFRIWHQGEDLFYAMHASKVPDSQPVLMRDFPVASHAINALMPILLDKLANSAVLRRKLFQMEFLSSTTHEVLVTLIYHRRLDEEWISAARALQSELTVYCASTITALDVIGRSRKQRLVLNRDYIYEKLQVGDRTFDYQQMENSFTQPNAAVCAQMLAWALNCVDNLSGDLLELYCGNGNFTVPLSHKFDRVLATEISKISVASANHNIIINGRENIILVRLSAEEFTQAYYGVRPFRRLASIDLSSYRFSTVFIDPPRAGLDVETCKFIREFDNILYVSCNPETLVQNLNLLTVTHKITRLALFDQFPYTHHMECGVLLSRR